MLSVILPVYNELGFIDNVIKFFLSNNHYDMELFIIDGGSTDGTIQIAEKYVCNYPQIKLLQNPNKHVPFALNMGIKYSTGDPIIRLDAHTTYAENYFEKIIETFQQTNADIVGGPMRAVGRSSFQSAVAYATSTSFGIGDSKIHKPDYTGESDHVYLGAWKRSLFDEIGFFDEKLIRDQDDEFHYRAKSLGKKIYLNSDIISFYYPRGTWSKLFSQYFQYGLFKPLVLRKIKSEIKLRHIIPSIFVIYLIAVCLSFNTFYDKLPLFIYLLLDIYFSFRNNLLLLEKIKCLIVYPTIHLAYGIGFIIGLIKK
ncbi:MAG TPA: glycosyltransferase family 2 protein [Ignavibacteriaceae bacterium]|nr:glycosyltransferase family 2 protein [Ignavibacteriaceae bacterium]